VTSRLPDPNKSRLRLDARLGDGNQLHLPIFTHILPVVHITGPNQTASYTHYITLELELKPSLEVAPTTLALRTQQTTRNTSLRNVYP